MTNQPLSGVDDYQRQIRQLEERIVALRSHLNKMEGPKPKFKKSTRPKDTPIVSANRCLNIMLFLGALWTFQLTIEAIFEPNEVVCVARVENKLQVWDSVPSFEKSTGHDWMALNSSTRTGDYVLYATYHGANRRYALQSMGYILFAISGVIYLRRKLKAIESQEALTPLEAVGSDVSENRKET